MIFSFDKTDRSHYSSHGDTAMGRKKSEKIPPYISYRTFNNFLSDLRSRGIPSRVDRSVMSHKSGTVQSQLLLAFHYLGLVKASGHPTQRLSRLVEAEGPERKEAVREMIQSSYDFAFDRSFGLKTATSNQAQEVFEKTGASGETVRRCIAFFLAAAKDGGIPVSPYIKPHGRKRSASRKKGGSHQKLPEAAPSPLPASNQGDESREVQLRSGGTLRLELSIDLFDLDQRDRDFVFTLIDQLKEYEGETKGSD